MDLKWQDFNFNVYENFEIKDEPATPINKNSKTKTQEDQSEKNKEIENEAEKPRIKKCQVHLKKIEMPLVEPSTVKKKAKAVSKKKQLFRETAGPQILGGPAPREEAETPADWKMARRLGFSKKEYRTMTADLQWLD